MLSSPAPWTIPSLSVRNVALHRASLSTRRSWNRHARGIQLHNVKVGFLEEDRRLAIVVEDANGINLQHVKAQKV